jgi:hypothetical protein
MRKTQRKIRRRRGTKKYVRGGAPPLVGLRQTPQHIREQEARGNTLDAHYENQPKKPSTVRTPEQKRHYNEINRIKKEADTEFKNIYILINNYIRLSNTPENAEKLSEIHKKLYVLEDQKRVLDESKSRQELNNVKIELRKIRDDVYELLKGISLSKTLGRTPEFRDTPLKSNYQLTPLQKTSIIWNPPPLQPQKTRTPPKHDFLSYAQPPHLPHP